MTDHQPSWLVTVATLATGFLAAGHAEAKLLDAVNADLSAYCPLSQQWDEWLLEQWQEIHQAVRLVVAVKVQQSLLVAFCTHMRILARAVDRTLLPLLADTCPTLLSLYFEGAANLSLAIGHPERARRLLQLGMPFRLMAQSRVLFTANSTRSEKEAEAEIGRRFHERLQALKVGSPREVAWELGNGSDPLAGARIELHSMCDTRGAGGGHFEEGSVELIARNHRAYANRWGYSYTMHRSSPTPDEEPQYGKLHLALRAIARPDPPTWFLWLDCDTLVANRSVPLGAVLESYNLWQAAWAVAEEPSGINSGVFLLRGGSAQALDFLHGAIESPWRFVWDQSQLFHRMTEESDIFARLACASDSRADLSEEDFSWARHLRTVHQRAMNLYTPGSAKSWGATGWSHGDFIIHFAGCPLIEPVCWQRFTRTAAWIEGHNP